MGSWRRVPFCKVVLTRGLMVLPDEQFDRTLRELRGWWEEVIDNATPPGVEGVTHLPKLDYLIRVSLGRHPSEYLRSSLIRLQDSSLALDERLHEKYGKREPGFVDIAYVMVPWWSRSGMVEGLLLAEEDRSGFAAMRVRPRNTDEIGFP